MDRRDRLLPDYISTSPFKFSEINPRSRPLSARRSLGCGVLFLCPRRRRPWSVRPPPPEARSRTKSSTSTRFGLRSPISSAVVFSTAALPTTILIPEPPRVRRRRDPLRSRCGATASRGPLQGQGIRLQAPLNGTGTTSDPPLAPLRRSGFLSRITPFICFVDR